jgi:leucyl aminopeptidase
MQITYERQPVESIASDALVLFLFEGRKHDRLVEKYGELFQSGEVAGKALELTLVHQPAGFAARRLLLAGLGKQERFSPAELRKAAGAALRHLKARSIRNIAFYLDSEVATPEHAAAVVEGALLGDFEPDVYKSEKNGVKAVERVILAAASGGADLEEGVRRGRILAECQNFTRDLVNEPANRLTPTLLAQRAREMAGEQGLEAEVLDQDRMKQLGMGSLLGVSQGSDEPPALIIIRYRPAGAPSGNTHLGLVGKGVTFDTGGISIKPADGMEKMKYDMAGGAAMLGAMRALAQLKPPIPVTALIPAVENMPGGHAQRPGDIVTAMSGKTIEVINTDAEGRLILADALTYAQKLGCTHLIDAATLTGAIVVALGHINVGVFTNNDALRDRLLEAAKAEGEKMWPMPLEDEYKEQYMKSAFADLPNVGGRWGGSITAAIFLKEFADPAPWVHLDIAGTAWLDDAKPFMAKGPSGVGVRTLVRLAMDWRE